MIKDSLVNGWRIRDRKVSADAVFLGPHSSYLRSRVSTIKLDPFENSAIGSVPSSIDPAIGHMPFKVSVFKGFDDQA